MDKALDNARKFAKAHEQPGVVVLPNAWDAGSAVMMQRAGFPFIATTSAGVAYTMGLPDGQRVSRERMLEVVANIVEAVDVPVTADLEAGYGDDPEAVALTVHGAIAAGAVGCNIEDATGRKDRPLYDIGLATERIRAGAEAARASGKPFVLNARTDPYLVRRGADAVNFEEAVRRANAYREAGASCLFVPGSLDEATMAGLVKEIHGPLNVLGARGGNPSPLGVADLERIGIRRISIGASLCVATFGLVQRALAELHQHGTFGYVASALPNATVNAIMDGREP